MALSADKDAKSSNLTSEVYHDRENKSENDEAIKLRNYSENSFSTSNNAETKEISTETEEIIDDKKCEWKRISRELCRSQVDNTNEGIKYDIVDHHHVALLQSNNDSQNVKDGNSSDLVPPMSQTYAAYCPVGLETLLESTQLVVHKENLRINQEINKEAIQRLEVVDDTRKVLFLAEQHIPQSDTEGAEELHAFKYSIYNRSNQEVMSVFCPSSSTCLCCNASWHGTKRCQIQVVIFCPPGVIAGFVRQAHTWFVQEFEILDTQETVLLRLRGGLNDLEIYSPDLENELGRLAQRGWVGIMHELKRSAGDWGITFPMDLDVRVKAILLGAVFVIDWLYDQAKR